MRFPHFRKSRATKSYWSVVRKPSGMAALAKDISELLTIGESIAVYWYTLQNCPVFLVWIERTGRQAIRPLPLYTAYSLAALL